MGWARFAHSMRVFVFNSGYFYIRPTQASVDLLNKVIYRVETESGWDQALFNECIFFPNSPLNKDPNVARRVMDIEVIMNSKVLFKYLRKNAEKMKSITPAAIHINYHSDKFDRLRAVWDYFVEGNKQALDAFPDGS